MGEMCSVDAKFLVYLAGGAGITLAGGAGITLFVVMQCSIWHQSRYR